jgi:acyl-coenzyme A synthetase/AMP-(fatty) acid ligase
VEFVPALPHTASGKVLKSELRRRYTTETDTAEIEGDS